MNFLRTLGWIALTVIVVVFSLHNWAPVTINLFGGLQADVKLPFLLLIFFLIGFVPLYLYHRAMKWTWKKRLANAEKPTIIVPTTTVPEPAPVTEEPF